MRTQLTALAATALLLLTAGCGDDAGDAGGAVAGGRAEATDSPTAEPSPSESEVPEETPSETTEPSETETTPLGTELSFGEAAVVPTMGFGDNLAPLMSYQVVSVKPSPETSFQPQWRVQVVATAIDDLADVMENPYIGFRVLSGKGTAASTASDDGCDPEPFDVTTLAPGDDVTLCLAVELPEGEKPTTVSYAPRAVDGAAENPIVWKK